MFEKIISKAPKTFLIEEQVAIILTHRRYQLIAAPHAHILVAWIVLSQCTRWLSFNKQHNMSYVGTACKTYPFSKELDGRYNILVGYALQHAWSTVQA